MQLVTRAMLGWPASAASPQATTLGTKVHYEGTPVSTDLLTDHSKCLAEWKAIRASHLANTKEGYVDIAYNFGACPHGYVLEGRGLGKETAANGNQTLNHAHYSVVGLVGSQGLVSPTDAQLHAIRDAIEYLQANGAGGEIKGHRDGYPTDCPGEPLYAWVQAGAPRPGTPAPGGGGTTPVQPTGPAPQAPAWPGRYLRQGMSGSDVRMFQQQMRNRGWTISVDGSFGPATDAVVRAFQREKNLGVDGIIGPKTWTAAWTLPVT